jgi:hypothetical protein
MGDKAPTRYRKHASVPLGRGIGLLMLKELAKVKIPAKETY